MVPVAASTIDVFALASVMEIVTGTNVGPADLISDLRVGKVMSPSFLLFPSLPLGKLQL